MSGQCVLSRDRAATLLTVVSQPLNNALTILPGSSTVSISQNARQDEGHDQRGPYSS
jgi:hypothetical protein